MPQHKTRPVQLLYRLIKDENGGSIIEYSILGPAFIAIMLAVCELGHYMWGALMLQRAVYDAVREASTSNNACSTTQNADISSRVASSLTGLALDGAPTVTTRQYNDFSSVSKTGTNSSNTNTSSNTIVVYQVGVQIRPLLGPIVPFTTGAGTFSLTSESILRVEPFGDC